MLNTPISIGGVDLDFKKLKHKYEDWLQSQHPALEVAIVGIQSTIQGAGMGYVLGSINPGSDAAASTGNPALAAQLQALQKGGPFVQARNLGVLTGANAALMLAMKRARKGKEDVWNSMAASFGSGVVYSLVTGSPNPLQSALSTGMAFAVFNGLFYQVSQMFKPTTTDTDYERGKYMLKTLGFAKFAGNLKKAMLTDNTIMLWNDSALSEARIPAGPRLVILHHLDAHRNPSALLKPALPLPPLPPPSEVMRQRR